MTTFVIDCDNNIHAYASKKEAEATNLSAEYFTSAVELDKLAENWPGSKLIEIWNGLPGVTEVKKFTDRKTGVARIWRATQKLAESLREAPTPQAAQDAPGATEPKSKATKRQKAITAAKDGSKKAKVLALLRRPDGASLKQIAESMGWQPHTVRGFVSGTLGKKMGLKVESFKTPEGDRAYRLQA